MHGTAAFPGIRPERFHFIERAQRTALWSDPTEIALSRLVGISLIVAIRRRELKQQHTGSSRVSWGNCHDSNTGA